MRIAFLITRSDEIGGAHIHVRDMALALKKNKCEVSIIIGGHGIFAELLKNAGIEVHCLKHLVRPIDFSKDFLAFFEIRKVLQYLKPDLLSIHSAKAGILGRLSASGMKLPVIFTAHGWSFTDGIPMLQRWLFYCLEKLTAPLSTRIICVSEYDRRLAINRKIGNENKIQTIHNGMPELLDTGNIADPGIDPPTFLMVARFDNQKDQALLIKATSLVKGFKLTLIGDGRLLQQAKDMVTSLNINDRVEFLGRILATEDIFSRYQGYLLISKWEGLPRSIIEAMRAGLPVIASDVGGCSEEIRDGLNGFIVPRDNLEILVSRLSLLASNPLLRIEMGKKSRFIYENEFIFQKMYTKTTGLYAEILTAEC